MKANDNILRGYTSINSAYEVKDYPYGFRLRTSIFYWIETKEGKGDRWCSYTIDPRNGRKNKPKCGTYSPFLYMYVNEENHVTTGGINSYHIDEFRLRFGFIINRIGEEFINESQKKNIRVNHYQHIYASAPYWIVKYSEKRKGEFKEWLTKTLKHIKTCEFKDLVDYNEQPPYDNPDAEIGMKITTYQTV